MVYGAINENGEEWYTQMSRVFNAIKNRQMDYNWLISDIELVPEKIYDYCADKDYCWLSGDELSQIVREDDRQWVWAVLSGFEKNIDLSEVLKYPIPFANGYGGFWENPLSIQHPLATLEIAPWDSGATLFFSKHKSLVDDFLSFFPFSEELSAYNANSRPLLE